MATETRKSDFVGDVFGDWTVVRKADTEGDRKRRWVVANTEGVEMTVLQTGLSDLALAKSLADRAAAHDAKRIPVLAQDDSNAFENAFTLTEAEVDLYRRLDNQIAEARTLGTSALLREAVASVALDNDPECGTYSLDTIESWDTQNPFDDSDCPECGDAEQEMPAISLPGPLEHQIEQIEAQISSRLPEGLNVKFDRTPIVASTPGEWAERVQEEKIQALIDQVLKAKVALNNVANALDGLR